MKNKLIILFLLLASWQVQAQKADYIQLLDSNKVWTEAMIMEFGDFLVIDMWTGDTLSNNDTLYYELFSEDFGTTAQYLREDTIEKKVYYRRDFGHDEQLYYDFSMEVGDSIEGANWPCMLFLDSVKIINYFGIERETFYLHSNWYDEFDEAAFNPVWVEGIGSLSGILNNEKSPELAFAGSTELNCYYYNDLLQYQSNMASEYGCHFESIGITEIIGDYLKLYPNPAKDYFYIDYKKCVFNKKLTLKLYDIFGNCIKQKSINCDKEQIDISNLPVGLYLINISSDNKTLYSNKLIKH